MDSIGPEHRRASLETAAPPVEFGKSAGGLPLTFRPCSGDCDVLMIAGTHGEEPETTVILSRALRCHGGPFQKIAVILAANPDGMLLGTRGNANGVDLNRNFPTGDWREVPIRYRWHLEETAEVAIGTGAAPASEPETRALLSLIETLDPGLILSLHAPLACVDDPGETPAGRWLAERTGLPRVDEIGYPTPGSLGTWARERSISLITWEFPRESVEALSRVCVPVLREFFRKVESGSF